MQGAPCEFQVGLGKCLGQRGVGMDDVAQILRCCTPAHQERAFRDELGHVVTAPATVSWSLLCTVTVSVTRRITRTTPVSRSPGARDMSARPLPRSG